MFKQPCPILRASQVLRGKESFCQCRRRGFEPCIGKLHWGAWWATVHGVEKSWTRLSTHTATQPSSQKKEKVNHLKFRKYVSKSKKITFKKKSRIKTSESTFTTLLYVRKPCWYCFPKYIRSLATFNQLHCCHPGPNHHPLTQMVRWSSHWLGCVICVLYMLLPAWQLEGFHQHLSIILPPSLLKSLQTVLISLKSKRQSSARRGPFPPFPFLVWSHPLPLSRNSTSKSSFPLLRNLSRKAHPIFVFGHDTQPACGILVPPGGLKPRPPTLAAQSLNHWATREVPRSTCLCDGTLHLFFQSTNMFEHLLYARHSFRVLAVSKNDTIPVLKKQADGEHNLITVNIMKKKNPGQHDRNYGMGDNGETV